jgi:hypothetical protein
VLKAEVTAFTKNKSRVLIGAKEARWNNKYMKIIENPIKQIEQSSSLLDTLTVITALLKSLYNIYNNSNFYKEARIVSFIDRLLMTIQNKLKSKFNLQKAVYNGMRDHQNFADELN